MSGHDFEGLGFKFLDRLKERHVFRVTAAYLGLAWLIVHVATVLGETFAPIHHTVPWLIYALAGGLPLVLIGAWFSNRSHGTPSAPSIDPGKLNVVITVILVLAVLALLADRLVLHRPANESMLVLLALMIVVLLVDRLIAPRMAAPAVRIASPGVAILPFIDMSPEKNQDYFCEGMAEEIINGLCAVSGLRVASRLASFNVRDRTADPREVGRLLNVQTFLHGSVRKSENRLRITAQLIKVADGFNLWSQTFDRKLEDVFAVQEEIARQVVASLRVNLLASDASRLQRRGTKNAAAYEHYLRGRQLLNKEKEMEQRAAVELFRQAIRLDPSFADAHAGLADVLTQLLRQRQDVPGLTPADAVAASQRAVDLAPNLSDAHVARGNALQLVREFDAAKQAFERAIALDPRHFHAHYWFAKYWVARGEHALAAKEYELAAEIQPDDYRPIVLALQEYQAIKDQDREQSALRRSWQALERHLAIDPDDSYANDHAAGVLMLLGRRDEANRLLDRALALRPDDFRTLYTAACTASLGGEYERALDFLDRAVATGRGHREWILNDNDLAPLRDHPRFKQVLARLE
ncbi:MAG TPA: tetratricopeptide repeat protein [Steroidobacteraceae bacterium]|jgi:Predicted integral membrane protein|nr:tetratricopeptide repeat protein [Steroidobacteraceae bacterium]